MEDTNHRLIIKTLIVTVIRVLKLVSKYIQIEANEYPEDNVEDHNKKTIKKVEDAIEKKIPHLDYFHKIITPKGTEKWMHAIANIKYDENNNPIHSNEILQIIVLFKLPFTLEKDYEYEKQHGNI